jgi:hypothetical protein
MIIAVALAVAAVGVAAAAKPTVVRVGNVVMKINGGVAPKALPKGRMAPITLHAVGQIGTKDGSQPPALRKVTIDFDKHGTINARGLKVCKPGRLQARNTRDAKKACKGSIVGTGKTKVKVALAEQRPFTTSGPLVLFNGGVRGKKTKIFIHAYVNVPAPTAIVTRVVVKKIKKGRYGTRAIATIPKIANGAGSVTFFKIKVNRKFRFKGEQRSYLAARCGNGRFYAHATSVFDDGTRASGTIVRGCTKRG